MAEEQGKNRNIPALLGAVAVGMFLFGLFIMPPLYDLLCEALGVRNVDIENGTYQANEKTQKALAKGVDEKRNVSVTFMVTDNNTLDFEFRPMVKKMTVHPGKLNRVAYYVKNNTGRTVIAQAIPQIMPASATKFLVKAECFCFTEQTLKPGESREMPLVFVVDPWLPKSVSSMAIAYRFVDTGQKVEEQAAVSQDNLIKVDGVKALN